MSRGDWSAVPARDAGVAPADGSTREARYGSATSTAAPAAGPVQGRPAPQYGEYAPAGWVNPVLAEQERAERQASAAAAEAASSPTTPAVRGARPNPTGQRGRTPAVAKRLGASPGDLLLTMLLLGVGLWTVMGSFRTGAIASAARRAVEQRYTELSDPSALSTAATINLVAAVVVLVLTAWWSVVRLRAGKRTAWVPLLGGVVSTLISTVVFMVVLMHDPAFASWIAQRGA